MRRCPKLNAEQWKHVGKIVADAEKVAQEFGLDLVFHPHVATYVETIEECEQFFDATSHTGIGLCLDTGHASTLRADPVKEAEKYKDKLRLVHIKDCNQKVLVEARRTSGPLKKPSSTKSSRSSGREILTFPSFFRTLKKNDYSGWMVVEQDVKFDAVRDSAGGEHRGEPEVFTGRRRRVGRHGRGRPIGSTSERSMTKKLGVGVLGVGEMGRRHAENLRHLVPNAQLVAVADRCGRSSTQSRRRTRN